MTTAAPPRRVGVVGAGTMGAGIAQISATAGIETVLFDPIAGAAGGGVERIAGGLGRSVERGRIAAGDAEAAVSRLRSTEQLDDLFGCDLVIEAAPEDLALKRDAFRALGEGCAPHAVLATNTSSIPVTAIATASPRPENVVGMHFFNPVPAMRLAEVIPAAQTASATVDLALAAARRFGKEPIIAADSPGFLVNRCGRPFYTEALRIVTERIATPEQVDRICRMGGGFRMGPFELMDLVGIDVGLAVMQSFATGSFGEPRWRPSPLQARLVAAGHLGRKSGRGWYDYSGGAHRPDDPAPPAPAPGAVDVRIVGDGPVAARLKALADAAGVTFAGRADAPAVLVDDRAATPWPAAGVRLRSCRHASLTGHRDPEAVGFCLPVGPGDAAIVEVAATRVTPPDAIDVARRLFTALGLQVERVGDGPGLVLERLVAQVVNEACFAVGEGIGSPDDVDTGVTLGLNYPRGPIAWGAALGFDTVAATLDGVWRERREERYRPAPLLGEAALTGAVADV